MRVVAGLRCVVGGTSSDDDADVDGPARTFHARITDPVAVAALISRTMGPAVACVGRSTAIDEFAMTT